MGTEVLFKGLLVKFLVPELNVYEHLVLNQGQTWIVMIQGQTLVKDLSLNHLGMRLFLPHPTSICMLREVLDTMVASRAGSTELFPGLPILAHLKWKTL